MFLHPPHPTHIHTHTHTRTIAIVAFLKSHRIFLCCVGDGANDIDMIKVANVGVGIRAGENQHAASSSDVAIDNVTGMPPVHSWNAESGRESSR
jgi:soluble P-type ATPase